MPNVAKKTISLTPEHAAFVEAKVASGEYASVSEVLREGLRSMQAREAVFEHFLRNEVVPLALELEAHPERMVDGKTGFARLRARIADRYKDAS
jgi:antitoxin ParD1/3/4